MENDIALMASGYLLSRLGILAAFGYLVYRFVRPTPGKLKIQSQSDSAKTRTHTARLDRY